MDVSSHQYTTNPQWRHHERGRENNEGGVLKQGNGTTDFGEVLGGTVCSKDANNKLRPCGNQAITAQDASTNAPEMHDARNFFADDVVDVIAGSDIKDTATLAAGDDPSNLAFTAAAAGDSRIRVGITLPTYPAKNEIVHDAADDLTNYDVTLYPQLGQDQHAIPMSDIGGGNEVRMVLTAVDAGDSDIAFELADPGASGASLGNPKETFERDDDIDAAGDLTADGRVIRVGLRRAGAYWTGLAVRSPPWSPRPPGRRPTRPPTTTATPPARSSTSRPGRSPTTTATASSRRPTPATTSRRPTSSTRSSSPAAVPTTTATARPERYRMRDAPAARRWPSSTATTATPATTAEAAGWTPVT